MVVNFPGPYEVELFYTVGTLQHVARYNCDVDIEPTPGDLPSTIDLKLRSGATGQLDTVVDAWCDLIKVIYNNGDSFDSFNFWKYDPGTFDRTFITTGALALAGDSASPATESHALILTFRTLEGGSMKVVLLESVSTSIDRLPYASAPGLTQNIMDFVVGTTSWMLARDTSYPIASLNALGGENEKLFQIHHR